MADPAAVTNSFTAATLAQSAKVNENFQDLVDWVNTNAVHLDASKAFTSVPSGPASDPTTANQLTRKSYVDGVFPVGMIVAYGGATAPDRWLLCDGTAVSRSTYSDLFAAIGTAYGTGDGSTTFNLPNLKGRVPVGLDASVTVFDTLGETGGSRNAVAVNHGHTATGSSGNASVDHTHNVSGTTGGEDNHYHAPSGGGYFPGLVGTTQETEVTHTGGSGRWTITAAGAYASTGTQGSAAPHSHTFSDTSTGQSATHTHAITVTVNNYASEAGTDKNIQPYQVVNYIIRTNVA